MSEPSQPPVPPAHLPATPQYAGQHTPQYPAAPQHPAGLQYPAASQHPATLQQAPAQGPAVPQRAGAGAKVALAIAVAAFAINLVMQFATPLLYQSLDGFEAVSAVSGVLGVLSLVAYAAALVLALAALRTTGARLVAGIALGIAGTGAIGILAGFAASLLYRFV